MQQNHFGTPQLSWSITALETPRVLRPCAGCHRVRPFACSERFRINGHQRRLDVWLIYRCTHCEQTWNFSIHERQRVDQIGLLKLQRFEKNDRDTAWEYAFALDQLKQTGARLEGSIPYAWTGDDLELALCTQAQPVILQLNVPHPVPLRLDQLLSQQTPLSRNQLKRRWKQGLIQPLCETKHLLKRPVKDKQRLWIAPTLFADRP